MGKRIWLVLAAAALGCVGCAAEDGTSDQGFGAGGVCTPGVTAACLCLNGTSSFQTCDGTGSSFGECQCAGMVPDPVSTGAAPGAANPAAPGSTGQPAPAEQPPTMADMPAPMTPPATEPLPMDPTMGAAGGAAPPPEPADSVPVDASCTDASDWDPMWAQFEDEVLRLTNEARAVGHNCDTEGNFGPTGPLTMNAQLRCSSRLHSMDMGVQNYFAHNSLDGRSPFDRMAEAGYAGGAMGENIAMGQQTPEQVVAGWLDSDGHCANIMNPSFTELGVGFWQGESDNPWFNGSLYWTQNFGAPGGANGWF